MATGFTPDEKKKKNSYGDAVAASGDTAVTQIPTGGTPAPASDGKSDTELSRNVNNSLNALGGMGVVSAVPLGVKAATSPQLGNVVREAITAGPGLMAGPGASVPARVAANVLPTLPGTNAALQQGAQANALAGVVRGFSGASAGLTAADNNQAMPAPAPQAGVTGSLPAPGAAPTSAAPASNGVRTPAPAAQPGQPAPVPAAQVIAQAQPAAAAAQPLDAQAAADRAAALGFMGTLKDVNQRAGAAIADVATFIPRGLAGAYDTAVVRPMRAAGIDAGYVSPLLAPSGSDPASQTPFYDKIRQQDAATAAATPAPAAAPAPAPAAGAVMAAPGARPSGVASPAAPAAAAPTDPNAVTNQVTRVGNSYSGGNVAGNIAINGQPAGFGGAVSPQNEAAAQALSDRYQSEAARGFQPAADPAASNPNPGLSIMGNTGGFGILDKGYQERRAASMPLSSITASKSEKIAALKQLENLDTRDMQAAQIASAVTRQGMADATTRRGQDVTASASQATNALGRQKLGLEGQELAIKQTAAGFTNRTAARVESLQSAYESAKPQDRNAIAEQLRVLTGKEKPAEWKAIALQGSTDAMGNKTEGVLAAVNERSGEVKRLDQAPKNIATDPKALAIKNNTGMSLADKQKQLKALGY